MFASGSKRKRNKMLDQNRFSEWATPPTRRRFAALVLACAALAWTSGAWAQSKLLDAPRAAGIVAERFDGFAAIRGAAPADIMALVTQVNAERRAVYAERAQTEKTTVNAVGKIYAVEIMKSAPPKTWFLSESGQWMQK